MLGDLLGWSLCSEPYTIASQQILRVRKYSAVFDPGRVFYGFWLCNVYKTLFIDVCISYTDNREIFPQPIRVVLPWQPVRHLGVGVLRTGFGGAGVLVGKYFNTIAIFFSRLQEDEVPHGSF